MSTPHINAKKGDFSETLLMSGDPLRVKYISDNFLSKSVNVNNVRGMLGYTGYYKGKRISIMSHGIGIPSCIIYTRELINNFGIKKIIRLGSCGTIRNDINIKDIIVAIGASTDSKVNRNKFNNYDYSAVANFNLVRNIVDSAKNLDIPIRIGNIFSTDLFYNDNSNLFRLLDKYGILGIEMEISGLYSIAAEFNISAASVLTVSDHITKGEILSSIDRQNTFNDMIKIALESVLLDE